jgi:hypothetical protein
MCVDEWNWRSKSKPFICSSLKLASKSRQDEMRCTFDIAKCDRIFEYMLQEKQNKLSSNHDISLPEQLKKHSYCKWHNSYSHATNDCNIFCRRVQSDIKEGRLKFAESPQMKLDKYMFLANINMVELDGKKVLVRPSQTESTKGKEVIIGEERPLRMIKLKSPKDGQWQKNKRSKPQRRLKSNIHLAKYKEGMADIRERKN